jgi:hypothetical protein
VPLPFQMSGLTKSAEERLELRVAFVCWWLARGGVVHLPGGRMNPAMEFAWENLLSGKLVILREGRSIEVR